MDLSSLTLAQLKDLEKRIPAEIKRREQEEKANVLNALKKLAESHGFNLDQLLAQSAGGSKTKGAKVPPKYRHPQQPELTWTGRGRQPQWVAAWLAQGNSLESITI
jgi:DNA-binding protein H-NS